MFIPKRAKLTLFWTGLLILTLCLIPAAEAAEENKQAPGLEAGAHKSFIPVNLSVNFYQKQEDSSWFANHQKIFSNYGIKANLKTTQPGLLSDGFSLGVVDVVSYLATVAKGADLFLVAKDSRRNFSLVVKKDGGVSDIKGLAGKKIAVPNKVCAPYVLALQALKSAGIKAGEVTFVEMASQDMPAQLKQGEVDAILGYTPWGLAPIQEDWGAMLLDAAQIFGERWRGTITHVVVANKSLADSAMKTSDDETYNNTLVRYLASLEKSALLNASQKNRDQEAAIFAKQTGVASGLEELALSKFILWQTMRMPSQKHVKPWLEAMKEAGMVSKDPDVSKLIYSGASRWGTILRRYGVQKW